MPYDPGAEWTRLHARGDLSSVGQSGLPATFNRWLYLALERRVRWMLRRHGLTGAGQHAFDIGAGTGHWVRVWHDLGFERVDGCDLVPTAVDRLIAEFGARGDRFVTADIGAVDPELPDREYPFVSVMNVLLHLTDEAAFNRALATLARLVTPGGWLLLVEPILLDPAYARAPTAEATSRARVLAAYRDPLLDAGLELVDLRGAVAMANNPIEAGSRTAYARYARWWRWAARRVRTSPGSSRWIGPLAVVLDRIVLATGAAPSSKIALFHRPAQRDCATLTHDPHERVSVLPAEGGPGGREDRSCARRPSALTVTGV